MQDNELLELCATVETIIYRNESNGYTVLELDDEDETTAVGIMPDVSPGENVRLIGVFKPHASYGMQFSVQTYEKTMPEDIAGILSYLSSGSIKGIGPATAATLVREFGEATLDVLMNEPGRVAKIKGISAKKANDISSQLKENSGIRELMLYLSEYDIQPSSVVKIYKVFGTRAVQEIEHNPYCLSDGDFGVSFEKADSIAIKKGKAPDDRLRVRAGLAYVLAHNLGNGHTCLPQDRLLETTCNFLGIDPDITAAALEEMIADEALIRYENSARSYIFSTEMFASESYIAQRLKMMMLFPAVQIPDIDKHIEAIESYNEITYASMQKEAITQALSRGLLVLTGGDAS